LASRSGDYASARAYLTESLGIYRQLGSSVPPVFDNLGQIAMYEGDYEQARVYFEECLTVTQERGHIVGWYWVSARLGYVLLRQGDLKRARSLFIEAQKGFIEIKSKIGIIYALEGLANLAVIQEQPERAARLFAWTDCMRETIGDTRPIAEQADVDHNLVILKAQLDEMAFITAQKEGRDMTIEQAIAYARETEL
jgi:tetratricopeptide (TPR) repeat protein